MSGKQGMDGLDYVDLYLDYVGLCLEGGMEQEQGKVDRW